MNGKIGSTFLKEIADYEPPFFWKLTLRQTVMLVGCILVTGLSYLIITLQLPDFYVYLFGGVIAPPFLIYGTKREGKMWDKLRFKLMVQKRPYQTEREREYHQYEFISKTKFKEDDQFG